MSSLYILEIKLLSEVSFANIFSHRVGSLFTLLMFSLAMQKLFFDEVPFVYSFLYFPCPKGCIGKKILLHGISEILLPMFSSRTFMVLWLMFKSFIHFEFILVYGMNWWSSFNFLHVPLQFSQILSILHCDY